MERLRSLIGPRYPVALAAFPYVDFHPSFPYSVFLGPGGAQYNAPQMYWRDIGTSVAAVYAHTYSFNRIYQRPIFPLGQLYSQPAAPTDRAIPRARPSLRRRRHLLVGLAVGERQGVERDVAADRHPPGRHCPTRRGRSSAAAPRGTSSSGPRSISSQPGTRSRSAASSSTAPPSRSPPSRPGTVSRPMARSGRTPGRRCCATSRCTSIGRWTAISPPTRSCAPRPPRSTHGGSPTVTLPVPLSASDPARRNEIPGSLGAGR